MAHSSLRVKGHGSKPSFPKAMPRRIPRSAGRTQQEHVSTRCFTLLLRVCREHAPPFTQLCAERARASLHAAVCRASMRLPLRGDMSSQARVGELGPQEAVLALGSLFLGRGLQGNSDKHMRSSAASPTSAWQSPQIYALGLVTSLLPTPALGAGTLLSRATSAVCLEPRSFPSLLLHFPRRDSGTVDSSQNSSSDSRATRATVFPALFDSDMPLRCWYRQVCSGPSGVVLLGCCLSLTQVVSLSIQTIRTLPTFTTVGHCDFKNCDFCITEQT